MDDDVIVGQKFKILRKIWAGSFSEIFSGVDIQSGEEVAIKREPVDTEHPRLLNESEMYRHLQGGVGIPSFKWFGVEGEYRFLVIELLGPSLEDLRKHCGGSFSLKTVLMLADQIINTFRYIHPKGVIHCDIKPEHLLMGVGSNANKVYLIDFGLAKSYRDPISSEHIPYREDVSFVGTRLYASIYMHCRIEQSRRDDAESLCYVLMYLLKGRLPWQELCLGSNDEKNDDDIMNSKYWSTKPQTLRDEYSVEFEECIHSARYVTFYCTPASLSMKIAFGELFKRQGYDLDHIYDWTTFPEDDIKLGTSSEKPKRILATIL